MLDDLFFNTLAGSRLVSAVHCGNVQSRHYLIFPFSGCMVSSTFLQNITKIICPTGSCADSIQTGTACNVNKA
jgi:hypothetical protein